MPDDAGSISARTDSPKLALTRARALDAAKAAILALRDKGVTAMLTGSLADGQFHEGSDIDLLVTHCPRPLKYAIEGVVEDCLGGFPFDVVYIDEIAPQKIASFLGKARDLSTLG